MLIVGEKEAENEAVAVRKQGEGDLGVMKMNDFAELIQGEIDKELNY